VLAPAAAGALLEIGWRVHRPFVTWSLSHCAALPDRFNSLGASSWTKRAKDVLLALSSGEIRALPVLYVANSLCYGGWGGPSCVA
jgi:hypothetical protein